MAGNTQAGGVKILWNIATVDFASTSAQTSTDSTAITVTGAALGDPVILGSNTTWLANIQYAAFVSAADAVTVRLSNGTSGALDPASTVATTALPSPWSGSGPR